MTSYAIDPSNPKRYTKKVTLYAQLPDGTIITRKTDHVYKFISAIRVGEGNYHGAGWGCYGWHETEKSARSNMQKPWSDKRETRVLPVYETEPEPLQNPEPPRLPRNPEAVAAYEGRIEQAQKEAKGSIILSSVGAKIRVQIFKNGVIARDLYLHPEHALRYTANLIKVHGFVLTGDKDNLVSPVSSYNPPEPEPTHLEDVRSNFMAAEPVETSKPSLSFPAPRPGLEFTTVRKGRMGVHFMLWVNGKPFKGFYNTKETTALASVKRFLGLGYALTSDGAGIVSPVSTYNPEV